jgi:hypothetical protein
MKSLSGEGRETTTEMTIGATTEWVAEGVEVTEEEEGDTPATVERTEEEVGLEVAVRSKCTSFRGHPCSRTPFQHNREPLSNFCFTPLRIIPSFLRPGR